MSNEYKLSYAASEIDAKLKEIGEHSSSIDKLSEDKVDLPKDADGKPINGTVGQFAVSDGKGGITWVSNFPTQSDTLDLILELGLVDGEPIADENGNLLTDENGVIYTI